MVGGRDARRDDRPFFMWYDRRPAVGRAQRARRTGLTSPRPGVGLAVQPFEGQERLTPVLTSSTRSSRPGGLGTFHAARAQGRPVAGRGGGDVLLRRDRLRLITCIGGGLPSLLHGVWPNRGDDGELAWKNFSGVPARGRAIASMGRRPAAAGLATRSSATRAVPRTSPTAAVTDRRAAVADYGVVVEAADAELAEYRIDATNACCARSSAAARAAARGRPGGRAALSGAGERCSTSSATTA